MKKELYQWQEECLEQWFSNNGRGIVQAVTGAGKTFLALTAAARLEKWLGRRLRVKIVVPTAALMRQWNQALREFLTDSCGDKGNSGDIRGEIGLRGGGHKGENGRRYMIYVINSARYELARKILAELRGGEAVLLIADECHHYGSGQNSLIFEFLPYIKPCGENFFSLGLSATLPAGEERQYLSSVLGREIYSYGMEEAGAMRTVCRYDIFHIGLEFRKEEREEYEEISEQMSRLSHKLQQMYPALRDLGQRERYAMLSQITGGGDKRAAEAAARYLALSYKRKSVVCLASERVSCVCALIERLDVKKGILIFGERVSQAEELYGILQNKYPGRVGRYHSKMGRQANKNVLERFYTGEIHILIACKAMDEGVDIPEASVGIVLSGTASKRQRVQRLGRIIRKKEGKGRASLYYLHIADTSEDSCFLPETKESRIFEIEYQPGRHGFSHPIYDVAAEELIEDAENTGMDREKVEEVKRCLEIGQVRADWMMGQEEIEGKTQDAGRVRERNYWVCMKRMGKLRENRK